MSHSWPMVWWMGQAGSWLGQRKYIQFKVNFNHLFLHCNVFYERKTFWNICIIKCIYLEFQIGFLTVWMGRVFFQSEMGEYFKIYYFSSNWKYVSTMNHPPQTRIIFQVDIMINRTIKICSYHPVWSDGLPLPFSLSI